MGLDLATPTQNAAAKCYHLPDSPLALVYLNCSSVFFSKRGTPKPDNPRKYENQIIC